MIARPPRPGPQLVGSQSGRSHAGPAVAHSVRCARFLPQAVAVAVAVWLTTVLLRTPETPSPTGRPAVVHQSLYDLPLRQVSARRQVGLVIEPSKHGVPFALAVDLHYDSDSRESGQLSPDDGQLAAPASKDSALFSLQYVLEGDAQVCKHSSPTAFPAEQNQL